MIRTMIKFTKRFNDIGRIGGLLWNLLAILTVCHSSDSQPNPWNSEQNLQKSLLPSPRNIPRSQNRVSTSGGILSVKGTVNLNRSSTGLYAGKRSRKLVGHYDTAGSEPALAYHNSPANYGPSYYNPNLSDKGSSDSLGADYSRNMMALYDRQNQPDDDREGNECIIPESWRGRWFHGGTYQHISLGSDSIGSVGRCVQRNRFYFLLHNTTRNCYQCLFITEKHHNLLHYKESYCMPKSTMNSICYTITGDAPLLSLYRADSIPVNCPLERNRFKFHFQSYFRQCQGKALSMLEVCTVPQKFVLKFQSCDKGLDIANQDFEIECIATWTEGNNNYFAARMVFQSNHTLKDYRCFIYEKTYTGYYLSMSQSSNCYGLVSATEGPFVFNLLKDQYPGEISNIRFPSYFESSLEWKVIGHKGITDLTYRFETDHPHILQKLDGSNRVLERLRCLKYDKGDNILPSSYGKSSVISANESHHLNHNKSDSYINANTSLIRVDTLVVFSIVGCHQGYRCIKIKRKNDQIIQLYNGNLSPSPEAACLGMYTSIEDNVETLIVKTLFNQPVMCPLRGIHRTESEKIESLKCQSPIVKDIHLGCHNDTIINVQLHCRMQKEMVPIRALNNKLTCHSHWFEEGVTYILAKDKKTNIAKCFVFDHNQNLIRIEPLSQLNCFPTSKDIAKRSLSNLLSKYHILNSETCESSINMSQRSRASIVSVLSPLILILISYVQNFILRDLC